jgi:hypothetical protein
LTEALNGEFHLLRWAKVLHAAASLASIFAKTSSAAMPLPKRWVSWTTRKFALVLSLQNATMRGVFDEFRKRLTLFEDAFDFTLEPRGDTVGRDGCGCHEWIVLQVL